VTWRDLLRLLGPKLPAAKPSGAYALVFLEFEDDPPVGPFSTPVELAADWQIHFTVTWRNESRQTVRMTAIVVFCPLGSRRYPCDEFIVENEEAVAVLGREGGVRTATSLAVESGQAVNSGLNFHLMKLEQDDPAILDEYVERLSR
jgi:hypothetical protein